MRKTFGFALLLGLILGVNSALFAQGGQNPPPMDGKDRKMGKRGGPDGMRGEMRGRHGGPRGHRGMRGRDGHRGGFGISDEEISKLNLTNDQKVKLFDFRKKITEEREAMRKNFKQGEGMRPEGITPEEMRQLMSAKSLGTLTPEQKAKLDAIEANRKEIMEKRKTEMEARRAKMEQSHQEFLNIFTLEQRKQIEQMRAERAKEMQERMKQRQERRKDGPGGQKPPQPKSDS